MNIKRRLLYLILLLVLVSHTHAQPGSVDKASFYMVMKDGKAAAVDSFLTMLNANKNTSAYAGALLMKKAGLVSGPAKKLNLFKDGRNKLEAAIAKDTTNAEWRLLRLMIQEHAPGILNYRGEMDSDANLVYKSYKSLPDAAQHAVLDYRKQSGKLQQFTFN